jgi:hypothetical protein
MLLTRPVIERTIVAVDLWTATMRELRETGSTAQDEDDPRPMPVLESAGVALQPVVGTVSAPIIERGRVAGDAAEADESPVVDAVAIAPSFDLPWVGLWRPSIRVTGRAGAVVVGMAIAQATGDVLLGATSGLLAWVIGQVQSVGRRVPFTFGEGFVGYRPDPVWPHGVQEDDDFRWNWHPRDRSDDDIVAPQG